MSSLWLSIEPLPQQTRLLLSRANSGVSLKALLPPTPAQPKALALLSRPREFCIVGDRQQGARMPFCQLPSHDVFAYRRGQPEES